MMFKQLCRLQRYTFLHELPNVSNTFLHELSNVFNAFLHELVLFIIIEPFHILPQFLVERMLGHRILVAQDDELHAGSRHRHVHAAKIFQKTDLTFIVRTDQRDENHVSFLALETIHRIYADQTAVRLEELILLDELLQILHLGTVWRNDAYVDALAQYSLLADLGEVFCQGEQGKLGFRLVDTPETLAHKLLLIK